MHDVLLFYLISEAMARPILFTESSAAVIVERLAGDYSGSKYFSSRLLNRQIKRVVHMAGVDLLKQILGQLEKILRSRQGFKWSIAFSSFLVLCLCIEQIESQAEAHITSLKSSSLLPDHLVAEPQLSCWSLENIMFSQFVPIFHAVYRTHNGGLNPLGKDLAPFSDEQLDEPSLALIKTIRAIEFDGKVHSSVLEGYTNNSRSSVTETQLDTGVWKRTTRIHEKQLRTLNCQVSHHVQRPTECCRYLRLIGVASGLLDPLRR